MFFLLALRIYGNFQLVPSRARQKRAVFRCVFRRRGRFQSRMDCGSDEFLAVNGNGLFVLACKLGVDRRNSIHYTLCANKETRDKDAFRFGKHLNRIQIEYKKINFE